MEVSESEISCTGCRIWLEDGVCMGEKAKLTRLVADVDAPNRLTIEPPQIEEIHMNTVIRHVLAASIVATLATGFAVPAGATDDGGVRKMTVKFGDLDISSPQGAASLYARIRAAARSVCTQPDDLWHRGDSCVQKAISDAVTQVNQSALFIVYNEHYKPALPITLLSQAH
jgi:UrcA family protein